MTAVSSGPLGIVFGYTERMEPGHPARHRQTALLRKFHPDSSLQDAGLASFKRQETTFIVLNLVLLTLLLLLHWWFSAYWGTPTRLLMIILGAGFTLKAVELIWLRRLGRLPGPTALVLVTWLSILVTLGIAMALAGLTDHEDSPYIVLLVLAILEAAFRFHLLTVVSVIAIADFSCFFWVWNFFRRHPPLEPGEYFEAAVTSLIFVMVGVVTWRLVNDLRQHQSDLAHNLQELAETRERLLEEEKLAAVGRLSSAIAHEIRNPVAAISSSIATAQQLTGKEREEMFEIASDEASRLVALTTDFLAYARPRPPQLAATSVFDVVNYVADACRAQANRKGIQICVKATAEVVAETDSAQLQQALINLVMNAVESSPPEGMVCLRTKPRAGHVDIEVENSGPPMREEVLGQIFEPFFTTKPQGTGLGLAIARNIARAHGGDLHLSANGPERICFSVTLPVPNGNGTGAKQANGKNSSSG